jgi:hypothetical protein
MGVDFNRISFGISSGFSRTGFGSIVSFPSEAPSFPPAGTVLSTYYQYPYSTSNGGASVSYGGVSYPSQAVDVDVVANGSGGSYIDWTSARNINYIANGEYIGFRSSPHDDGNLDLEVPSGSGNFFANDIYLGYSGYHDGFGAYYEVSSGSASQPSGYVYTDVPNQSEVPEFSGTNYNNGTFTRYSSNGNYGYTESQAGSYYSNGVLIAENISGDALINSVEVPNGSGSFFDPEYSGDRYTWNGSGGYYHQSVWYKPSGTFIYNDGTYDYFWNGSGSYYS